jgi:hypothetical protein
MSKIVQSKGSSQAKPKDKYRVKNWSAYNRSLKNRGSLTLWLDEDLINKWYDERPAQKGGQYKYSESCILVLYQLKVVFDLRFRQLEGFAESLMELMGQDLEVPSYSQICRRGKKLNVPCCAVRPSGGMHIVMDSTGLKVYGEGEWKVRKHGWSKRRTWRKLHISVDQATGMIHAHQLSESGQDDAAMMEPMLDQIPYQVDKVSGDGAYDKKHCWQSLEEKDIDGLIPPRRDAVYWLDEEDRIVINDRNRAILSIEVFGRQEWKLGSGYSRRSLAETAVYRYKTIFGPQMYARKMDTQITEAAVKIRCLNLMTKTGMPESVKMAS